MWEWEVQGLYGGAWECVTTESSKADATARMIEYRVNEKGTVFRISKVRAE